MRHRGRPPCLTAIVDRRAPRAPTWFATTTNAPIEFRAVPERNAAGCTSFDAALWRVHMFRATGEAALVASAGGITSNMTQTSPGRYTTDFSMGGHSFRVVANAASTPKSLTITERRSSIWGKRASFAWVCAGPAIPDELARLVTGEFRSAASAANSRPRSTTPYAKASATSPYCTRIVDRRR